MQRLVLACALAAAVPRVALADAPPGDHGDHPVGTPAPARDIEIEVPGERSRNNKLMLGGMLAATVIVSGLGVYYHLDSRDASDAVASDEFTGEAWTEDHIALVDRAERSKTNATIAYSISGALLLATVVTYIVTEPKSETAVIRTGVSAGPTPDGGAMVSKMWSF